MQRHLARIRTAGELSLLARQEHPSHVSSVVLSVLDLVAMRPGEGAGVAIARSVETARHVERLGYKRFWLAEHHSIPGLACSATSVLITHVANATRSIRVGSGGIMLPNHPPLVVAEQFGTLESLFPGRIDLGLGRAPGSDRATMRALRRDLGDSGDNFPALLQELRAYLGPPVAGQRVFAYPGQDSNVPITLLGSSDFSGRLAGLLGLPFAFASHFAPEYLLQSLRLYRETFTPSAALRKPYATAGVPVIVAPTDAEAQRLLTTPQQRFLALIRHQPVELKPPVDSMDGLWNALEKQTVDARLGCAIVGSPDTVASKLGKFLEITGVQEIFVVTDTYEQADRLRSYELLREVVDTMPAQGRDTQCSSLSSA